MKLRNLRLAWRLLAREPVYSAVAVLGLAVALAACFLLFGLVRYAWSYNGALQGAGGIYVVKERRNMFPRPDWVEKGPPLLAARAKAAGLVSDSTDGRSEQLAARIGERLVQLRLTVVEPNYLAFFGIRALAGDADAALALRLFGTADALGKVLTVGGAPFVVRAVIADLPANTSPDFGALLGKGVHSWDPPPTTTLGAWSRGARLYLRPAPGVGPAQLEAALERIVATERDASLPASLTDGRPKPLTSIAVTALSRVYFDADLLAGRAGERYGSPAAIAGLGLLGLLILALAAVNYINLAAVRTAARRREIAVRKALGISGIGLAGQFVAESLLVGASSTLLGALLAWLTLPLFSELVGRPLAGSYGLAGWALMAAIGLGTGLLSGVRLRRVLTVAQFAAAIGLVTASMSVWWQASYASAADPGFDPSPQLVLALPGKPGSAAAHAFKAELVRSPMIEGAVAMAEAIGRDEVTIIRNVTLRDGTRLPIEGKEVGANFFQVLGLRPLAGRLFAREGEDGVVLNARAVQALGFASPEAAVGQIVDGKLRVIGVAPDLRFTTLRQKPGPIIYAQNEDGTVLTVRVRGPLPAARAFIEALWARHFPNDLPDIETATSVFAHNYADDLRQARVLALASVVATALACFGIYVLASYTIRRRAREFVLRKLHGATARHIGLLVAREWLGLLGLGALLALAPAWLWTERYLAGFVERAPMGWWPLVLACAGVGLVGLAGCARQALAAMRVSPALALRDQ